MRCSRMKVAALLFWASLSLMSSSPSRAQSLNVIRIGELYNSGGDPQGLYIGATSELWRRLAYEPLLDLTAAGYRAVLATSWRRTIDNDILLKLREGVRFSTNSHFTASDVKASWERMTRVNPVFAARSKSIGDIQAINDYTLLVKAARNDVVSLFALSRLHIIQGSMADREVTPLHLAGTGRAIVKSDETRPGEKIVLIANPLWWGKDSGFQRLEIFEIPNMETLVMAFRTGELNAIVLPMGVTVEMGDKLLQLRELLKKETPQARIFSYRGGFVASDKNLSKQIRVDDDSIEFASAR